MDSQVSQQAFRTHFQKNQSSVFTDDKNHLIKLSGLNVHIKNKSILSQVDFVLREGELVFVTGATGAGKTTLLNILSGDYFGYEISGEIVRKKERKANRKIFTSRVFQDLKVFKNKSVIENLNFSFDEMIYPEKVNFDQERDDYLKIFGIYDLRNNKIRNTNGGVHQKVAIIRALLSKPDIIVADEPTSALDKKSSMQVFDVLNHLNGRENITIIWATHNRDLVKNFHGRVVHLENGRILYSGKTCFI